MSEKNKKNHKEIPNWAAAGHQKPVTRREMLAAGVIPFAAHMFIPSWVNLLLGSSAQAQTANCVSSSTMPAFINLHLSGGAAMAANWVPTDKDGQLLTSYSTVGLGRTADLNIVTEFGGAKFAGMRNGTLVSKMLQGIRSTASADALANSGFIGIACSSRVDTNSNNFDLSGLLYQAGLSGEYYGNSVSNSGGSNNQPVILPPPSPVMVTSVPDILNSVGYTAALQSNLTLRQRQAIAKLSTKLTTAQGKRLATVNNKAGIDKLLECAGVKNETALSATSSLLDARANSAVASAWGINAGTQANNRDAIFGSVVSNSIRNLGGASVITMGGFDYHGGRDQADTMDLSAGQTMGRVLQTAHVLKQKVFLYVTSDGSMTGDMSDAPSTNWAADSAATAAIFCLMYDPNGRPAQNGHQVGYFSSGTQSTDTSFVASRDAQAGALAAFANYLKFAGKHDQFDKIVGRVFTPEQMDLILKVG